MLLFWLSQASPNMAGMEELRSVKNTLMQVASQLERMQSHPGMTCELFVIRSMHYFNNL